MSGSIDVTPTPTERTTTPVLEVEELGVTFTRRGEQGTRAVDGVSFAVAPGETIGLVGESGCGKSVTSLAVMGLLPKRNVQVTGSVRLDGRELLTASDRDLRRLRGADMAMVFQDPLSSLHPMHRIGWQIAEAIQSHERMGRKATRARVVELLRSVEIPSPEERADAYPHELSGGMRQRVMIAMALALGPDLLIADEPTSALDVTVQAQTLELLRRLQEERGMAMILVSHDLGVIAEHADDVAVMYGGRIVERGPTEAIMGSPMHPYTRGLLSSIPHVDGPRVERLTPIPGSPPAPARLPSGCAFHPRCTLARVSCADEVPPLQLVAAGHRIACPVVASDPALLDTLPA
jgi:peptide/nickel transport system ATP-binding protein